MNSLPANQLLRVVQSIQAERRREAVTGRLSRPNWPEVEPRPDLRNVPATGRREPTGARQAAV